MRLFSKYLLVLIIGSNPALMNAQEFEQDLNEIIESIAEERDMDFDYSFLYDRLSDLNKNPVNINSREVEDLGRIGLLSDIQINNLKNYIKNFGPVRSIYELQYVEGFSRDLILQLNPFIRIDERKKPEAIFSKGYFDRSQNELILRGNRVLERQKGYRELTDSAWLENPSSRYLGDPWHLYARYKFKVPGSMQAALLAEKDPGEVFLISGLSDSILQLAEFKPKNGFDFHSAHLYLENLAMVNKITVGDYHLEFGQGLTLWSGFSMGKSPEVSNVKKYASGIRPNTSSNESLFMQGAATEVSMGKFKLSVFYSDKNIDGNVIAIDTNGTASAVSSLQATGYHRTVNEILDKKCVKQSLYGGNLSYNHYTWQLGFTAFKSRMTADYIPESHVYNQFGFSGNETMNMGLDYDVLLGRTNFFGEFSRSDNGAVAMLTGLSTQLESRLSLSLLYRNYPRNFQNLFSAAFSENTDASNEKGFYAGISSELSRGVHLSAYADIFSFPWLKFRVNKPSGGAEILLQSQIRREEFLIDLKYRYKSKAINLNSDDKYTNPVIQYKKQNFRFNIKYKVTERLTLANRLEMINFRKINEESRGVLLYQDLGYHALNGKTNAYLRYALFDTDTYDSRIYMYENDLLYAFSVPAFDGKGTRVYILLNRELNRWLEVWLKYGITVYSDRAIISSGLNEIGGNRKSEFKLQIRMRF